MNKPITQKQIGTWDQCQKEAWSDKSVSEKIRVRIMQEAYDCADRGEVEAYNSVKVMCSDVLALLNLAIAAEREACAKLCDDKAKETFSGQCQVWGDYFARAIRARGK